MNRFCGSRRWTEELKDPLSKRGLQVDFVKEWVKYLLSKKKRCPDYDTALMWAKDGNLLGCITSSILGGDPSLTLDEIILESWWEGTSQNDRSNAADRFVTWIALQVHPDASGISLDQVDKYYYNGDRKLVLNEPRAEKQQRNRDVAMERDMHLDRDRELASGDELGGDIETPFSVDLGGHRIRPSLLVALPRRPLVVPPSLSRPSPHRPDPPARAGVLVGAPVLAISMRRARASVRPIPVVSTASSVG